MSLMHPVGPEPPSVYWVRRVIVLLAVLLVLLLLWWLFVGRSSGSPSAGPSPGASTPSSTPPTTPSQTTTSQTTTGSTPSTSSTGTPDCTNQQITVAVTTDAQTYPAGADPTFTLAVTNTSSTPCLRDVGSAAETLTVTSGQTRIWSSDDCSPPGSADVQKLQPNHPLSVSVQWGRSLSQPGCPTGQPAAQPGTYHVVGSVGDKRSAPTTFSLA